jgi:uncharacterized protein YggU (UPF0235/DUF167 family)
LDVKVVPGASKTELIEVKDGRARIRVAAAHQDNKANTALIAFLSKSLGYKKSSISIAGGAKSKMKTISLPSFSEQSLRDFLSQQPSA